MNKFLTVAAFVVLASPAFAQAMAAPAANDGMAGPMAHDAMKMDHKKPMKKPAMKHDGMGMAAPQNSMAGGMSSGNSGGMSGPGH